jgi:hypothetical protein
MAKFEKGNEVFDVGNPGKVGKVVRAGEEVSEVKWPDGRTQNVTHQHLRQAVKDMTGQELLELYNKHAEVSRTSKFQTKEEAIERIKKVLPEDKPSGRKPDLRKIEVVSKANPHREGSAHHAFFEAMVSGETVQEYKDRYPDKKLRRDAGLYLSQDVRAGHVKVTKS